METALVERWLLAPSIVDTKCVVVMKAMEQRRHKNKNDDEGSLVLGSDRRQLDGGRRIREGSPNGVGEEI
eukprot:scaffold12881_cov177-Amphora_coffeaeformis.AAC.4